MTNEGFRTTAWTRIESAGKGDPAGFEYLAERYYWPLRTVLLRFLNRSGVSDCGQTLIDDMVQACFLKLMEDHTIIFRADRHYGSKFRSYLCGVAISIARNELRKLRTRGAAGSGNEHASVEVLLETGKLPAATESDEYTQMDSEEDKQAWAAGMIHTAIALLRKEDSSESQITSTKALAMSVLDEKKPNEIARELGVKPDRVYRMLYEARQRLRKVIARLVKAYAGRKHAPEEITRLFGKDL